MTDIFICYLTDRNEVRTVQASSVREVAMGGFFIEYSGPDGTGRFESSKLLTISSQLSRKEIKR